MTQFKCEFQIYIYHLWHSFAWNWVRWEAADVDRNMLKDNNKAMRGPFVLRKLTIILFDAEKVFLEVGARFSQ